MQKLTRAYTPEQVSDILQLNKSTVYELISRGEIPAKKFGKVYRIPPASLSFVMVGLDYDLYLAEKEDLKNVDKVRKALDKVRKDL